MLYPAVIVGDTTDHGGTVISGAHDFLIGATPLAHVGCEVICPLHGLTRIVTGQHHFLVSGLPVAITGDLTSCGARLIAGKQSCTLVYGHPPALGAAVALPAADTPESEASAVSTSHAGTALNKTFKTHYDERFQVCTAQQQPLGELRYILLQNGHCVAQGTLDSQGMSCSHASLYPTNLAIAISAPSPILE